MNKQSVMMPVERRLMVGGREYVVRKIGMRQGVEVAGFLANFGPGVMTKAAEAQDAGVPEILAIAQAVGEDAVPKLLQIFLNAPSLEDGALLANVSLEEVSEIIEAITEVNDFKSIIARFQKAAANVGGLAMLNQIKTPGAALPPASH